MKRFTHGALSKETAPMIAQRIVEMFAGKLFAVAIAPTYEWFMRTELHTDCYFLSDWTKESKIDPDTLVHCSTDGEFASISFSAGGYFYCWNSNLQKGRNHVGENGIRHTVFNFEANHLEVEDPRPISDCVVPDRQSVRKYTFKAYADLPWDTDEYHERYLRAHWKAAGRQLPEAA